TAPLVETISWDWRDIIVRRCASQSQGEVMPHWLLRVSFTSQVDFARQALGLEVPAALLARADEVIEQRRVAMVHESAVGPNRLKAEGQSVSLCSRSSCGRAGVARPAGFRRADRSRSPWYAVTSGCCKCADRDRCLRPTRRPGVRIGALSWAGRLR